MKFLLGVLVGLLLALLLGGSSATVSAQNVVRAYGTVTGGAAIPLLVDSDGALSVRVY